ncbi:TIGR03364 family FAD-dependent oxidoreductase [Flavobacterium cerinum]|uniref:TIGR03364 family FAD-dependent oxidoreductase n=1 Tax=Flavobacterium cerinum TaxID=2502784 RepID=A0A3S4ST08_9FLAO|nr:TIGR03364 family FAD-dependent oxidoreductase [Flavobacterium cerinum]RWW91754.1 TIGR03364 family FAD-dependent oxidoreductase [Flavobacterium cerinum]
MDKQYDLIVIGGGALGAFHAYHALQAGLSVALIEKDKQPVGATVRNFGQVVPSGMDTKWQNYGRESLKLYNDLQSRFDISVRKNGSVYLASNEEEVQLIEELSLINKGNDYESHLLTKEQCLDKYPGLRNDYVKAGLFFPEEVTVEPRVMINRLLEYLISQKGLIYFSNTKVIRCEAWGDEVEIETAGGEVFKSKKVLLCCGSEFKTLYPEVFAKSDLEVTKLQMLQTKPQAGYTLNGSILTGLSIRRYEAFYECPSFKAIKAKENPDSFEKKWGVHILFKQALDGSVIIGDSHEYADAANIDDLGFDLRMDIDEYMIEEAKKIFNLPTFEIQNRWFGMYSQCKENDIFQHTVDNNIHIVTGIGGKGMTGSAGFSKENIKQIFNLS